MIKRCGLQLKTGQVAEPHWQDTQTTDGLQMDWGRSPITEGGGWTEKEYPKILLN